MTNFFIEIKSEINTRVANNEFFNHEEAFSSIISFYLHQAGVIEGFNECYIDKEIKGTNVKINGFYFSDDQKNLDLFISYWDSDDGNLSIDRLERKQLLKQEKLVKNFLEVISAIQLRTLEESSTIYEFASEYKTAKKKLEKIRLLIFADGHYTTEEYDRKTKILDYDCYTELWDASKISKLRGSNLNSLMPVIEIEPFKYGHTLYALKTSEDEDIETYLTAFPGDFVAEIYDKYELRLLENNVRVYLQSKGKVNKGIKSTINEEPQKFISYNNGLSITVENMELEYKDNLQKIAEIKSISGMQIVNGGQTTATIREVYNKEETGVADARKISVPVKINLIKSNENKKELISNISNYSNTQNGIKKTDILSSHPYFVDFEYYTQSTRSLAGFWYFERLRGKYSVEKFKSHDLLSFSIQYPQKRLITKDELIQLYLCSIFKPFKAIGGAANQSQFVMDKINDDFNYKNLSEEDKKTKLPKDHFIKMISLKILYDSLVKIMRNSKEKFPKKTLNSIIARYTLSYFSSITKDQVNYELIFNQGSISSDLSILLTKWLEHISYGTLKKAQASNYEDREYFKQEKCWEFVSNLKLKFSGNVPQELKDSSIAKNFDKKYEEDKEYKKILSECMDIKPKLWERIMLWLNSQKKAKNSGDIQICLSLHQIAKEKWASDVPKDLVIKGYQIFSEYQKDPNIK